MSIPGLSMPVMAVLGDQVSSVSLLASSSNQVIPATARAGDLAYAFAGDGLAGWETAVSTTLSSTNRISHYKILEEGDAGASLPNALIILVFRGNRSIRQVTVGDWNGQATNGNPGAQTVIASGASPLIILGAFFTRTGGSGNVNFSTQSPVFAGTVDYPVGGASTENRVGYKIYNTVPSDHTIDVGDNGDDNHLHSGYLAVR